MIDAMQESIHVSMPSGEQRRARVSPTISFQVRLPLPQPTLQDLSLERIIIDDPVNLGDEGLPRDMIDRIREEVERAILAPTEFHVHTGPLPEPEEGATVIEGGPLLVPVTMDSIIDSAREAMQPASGVELDLWGGRMCGLPRDQGETDVDYRARLVATHWPPRDERLRREREALRSRTGRTVMHGGTEYPIPPFVALGDEEAFIGRALAARDALVEQHVPTVARAEIGENMMTGEYCAECFLELCECEEGDT
jgi:hypothetical protein